MLIKMVVLSFENGDFKTTMDKILEYDLGFFQHEVIDTIELDLQEAATLINMFEDLLLGALDLENNELLYLKARYQPGEQGLISIYFIDKNCVKFKN